MRALFRRASVGLLAGTLWGSGLRAQDTTVTRRDTTARPRTAADSARADSLARLRQLEQQRRAADTIKAPLAHPEMPAATTIGEPFTWDRTALFSTGAFTLGELGSHAPGLTVFRAGWIGSPHVGAWLGDFRRVRAFYDGVEIDALDPRLAGMLDLSMVPMWEAEAVQFEPTAGEMRMHLSSWRIQSTTPVTRVDFGTGDLKTNVFRGYFGRRFPAGQALQLGAYQFATHDPRNGGDAHDLSLWGRVGWARKAWSVDATWLRRARTRDVQSADPPFPDLPSLDGSVSVAYVRAAYGDPRRGPWLQAIAASEHFTLHGPVPDPIIDSIPGPDGGGPGGSPEHPDTIRLSGDTTRGGPQYVLTGGVSRGPLKLSAAGRLRAYTDQGTLLTPSARAVFERPRYTLAIYGERSPSDSVLRADLSARILPVPRVALRFSVARDAPIGAASRPTSTSGLAEAGFRVGRVWITGGVITRDTALLIPPVVFNKAFQPAPQGRTTGVYSAWRGKVWRDVGIDFTGVRYNAAGEYLPQYQARSQLYFESSFLKRFPSGHLHVLAALTHEYRSQALFPTAAETFESSQYRVWGFQLEIRLLSATLSYEYRNFFGAEYTQVPGLQLPRQMNHYALRWSFFN